jgi:hypothetical protein
MSMKAPTIRNHSALNPQGFLIYMADGFVSAQLMKPGASAS